MRLLTCQTMRDGVMVSGAFLLMGAVLIYAAAHFLPAIDLLKLIVNVLGIVCLLLAPVILISMPESPSLSTRKTWGGVFIIFPHFLSAASSLPIRLITSMARSRLVP